MHHDGNQKSQRKCGVTMVNTQSRMVGVYTRRGGTAKEGAKLIFQAAFAKPQATMESAIK